MPPTDEEMIRAREKFSLAFRQARRNFRVYETGIDARNLEGFHQHLFRVSMATIRDATTGDNRSTDTELRQQPNGLENSLWKMERTRRR